MWYGDHGGGHVSARLPVRGAAATSERAAAALGGGCRGPVARSRWGARCRSGLRDERDHRAAWGGGVGGGGGSVFGRPGSRGGGGAPGGPGQRAPRGGGG